MLRGSLPAPLGAILLACAACRGGTPPPPPLLDAVWCDVQAVPCIALHDPGGALPLSCSVAGTTPLPASVPGGDRVCFDSMSTSPQSACQALCDPSSTNVLFNPVLFPQGCSAAVDMDGTAHQALNAQGFRPGACTGNTNGPLPSLKPLFSSVGTETVEVAGTGTASYGAATQGVVVHAGRVNVDFPVTDASCNDDGACCSGQCNQIELAFDDFSVGGLEMDDLAIFLDGPTGTTCGAFVPPEPPAAPDPSFLVYVGGGYTLFDVIATIRVNGAQTPGFVVPAVQVWMVSVDRTTGAMALQFSIDVTIDGQPFALSGSVTATAILDEAPVVTAPATASVDAGAACTVDAPLTASASSPVGLPVTLTYAVDETPPALAGPTATATLAPGSHEVAVFVADTLGATTRATETVSVTGSCP